MLRWAVSRGMTATFHWHNDRAVHHLLDVLERVNAETPIAKLRWSIAHLNDASPDSLKRMKAMGLGWLMQNAFYFRGEAFLGQRGAEVARLSPPIVTALRMGMPVGGGTDAHRVMAYSPFVSLQWMLDGKTVGGAAMRAAGGVAVARSRRCGSTRRAAPGSRSTTTSAARLRWASSPISRC